MSGTGVAGRVSFALWSLCWLCATGGTAGAQSWTTVPEFALGGAPAGDSLWFVVDVSVGPTGIVYVAESMRARRVTAWEPQGTMVLELGRSSVAGEFGSPIAIHPDSSGLWVRYQGHLVRFSEGGLVLARVILPPEEGRGFGRITRIDDDLFLAVGARPTNVGTTAEEAVWDWPLLRVERTQDGWTTDTIAVLDASGSVLSVNRDDGSSFVPSVFYTSQPFADNDFPYVPQHGGRLGIVRRRAPGQIRLTEISASGDTAWSRRVQLEPQRLTTERVRDTLEDLISAVLAGWDRDRHEPQEILQERAEETLHVPEYLPGITTLVAASSGEMWLRSSETTDTLVTWYTFTKDDPDPELRRVSLPTGFHLRDATTTHVWGTRMDRRGASQVLGRRLVLRP